MTKFLRVVSLLLVAVCLGITGYAKPVNESTAKAVGSRHLIMCGVPGVQSAADLSTVYVATSPVGTSFYVFGIVGGTGFVMVSGDDIVTPILGYSSEANFQYDNAAPAAKRWFDGYKNEIAYVVEHNTPAQPGTTEMWTSLMTGLDLTAAKTTAVTPLLTTTWDQAPFYNMNCPGVGVNKAVTGCVATAMAQIMKYHNWPSSGNGYHSYTSQTNSYNLSANFGTTSYNWTGMPNSLSGNNANIGLLMLHCGIAVDMDYTAAESGAYVISLMSYRGFNCAEYALKTYFRYKPTLKGIPRSGLGNVAPIIAVGAWKTMIKAEMDAHRPVLYSGSSTTAGGHAWVCDGYDATDKMHFNWGWGGTGPNGYYSVDAIAPPALGIGGGGGNFNSNQTIIIGIEPDAMTSSTSNLKMLSNVTTTTNMPIPYIGGFSLNGKIQNSGTTAFNGQLCAQAFDMNGNLVSTIQLLTGQIIGAGDSTSVLTFTTTGQWELIPGLYNIRIMSRTGTTGTWTAVANNGSFYNQLTVGVSNFRPDVKLWDSLHVGTHTIMKGGSITVSTELVNFGSLNFSGTVQAIIINTVTGIPYTIQSHGGETIWAGYSNPYNFTIASCPAPAGSYVLCVQHQPGSAGSFYNSSSDFYSNPVKFTILPPVSIAEPGVTESNIQVYPNPATDIVSINLQGGNVDEIRISDIQGREMTRITPDMNQSVIEVPVSNYAAGVYMVQLKAGNDVVTKKIVVTK